eukprot:1139018-Pelagomonas_calceolata.AAC.14
MSDGSKLTTEMWIGSGEFGIEVSYHVFFPDREEHKSSSGLCVENGRVGSMSQGLHSHREWDGRLRNLIIWFKGRYDRHQKGCLGGQCSSSVGIVGCGPAGRPFF